MRQKGFRDRFDFFDKYIPSILSDAMIFYKV